MSQPLSADERVFHFEEYKRVGGWFEDRIKESNEINRYGMVGIAGLSVWITQSGSTPALWLIPIVCSIGIGLRQYSLATQFRVLWAHMKSLESSLGAIGLGLHVSYDRHVDGLGLNSLARRSLELNQRAIYLFWYLVALACVVAGVLSAWHPPSHK